MHKKVGSEVIAKSITSKETSQKKMKHGNSDSDFQEQNLQCVYHTFRCTMSDATLRKVHHLKEKVYFWREKGSSFLLVLV